MHDKPAPIQVTWLAYPGSTGVSSIDYRLTDPYLDPPGMFDDLYVERSVRLPDTFWVYDPLEQIDVAPLPFHCERTRDVRLPEQLLQSQSRGICACGPG